MEGEKTLLKVLPGAPWKEKRLCAQGAPGSTMKRRELCAQGAPGSTKKEKTLRRQLSQSRLRVHCPERHPIFHLFFRRKNG